MVAPIKTKTWIKYSTYVALGDGPTPQSGQSQSMSDARLVFYRLKTTFLAAGWEVVSSCGYYDSAWHYGAADHWPDAASVRWKEADNKFGWIILKNTNLHAGGNGFQVCIALTYDITDTKIITMGFSCEGGFSGGSEMVRPTATDEVIVINNGSIGGLTLSNVAMNIWYTSDGTSFRLWWGGLSGSSIYPFQSWMFEKLVDVPSWLDKPILVLKSLWERTSIFSTSSEMYFCCDDFLKCPASLLSESFNSGLLINHAAFQSPDLSGKWQVFPVFVISRSPFVKGYIGKLSDLWVVPDAISSYGDYMPGDGSKEFVVMKGFLLGNDGTSVTFP